MKKLNPSGHRESEYDRPTSAWVCGSAQEGVTCLLGPTGKGCCQAAGECVPVCVGDVWHCTRSEARGGVCENGPDSEGKCCRSIPQCVPLRNSRIVRRNLVFWFCVTAVGLLFILSTGAFQQHFFIPGDLGYHHGAVIDDCGGCHKAARTDLFTSFLAILGKEERSQHLLGDSELCLNCHKVGVNPFAAHSISHSEMRIVQSAMTGSEVSSPIKFALAQALPGVGGTKDTTLLCATCHTEHQGQEFDLQKMSNDRCQSCHAFAFASLEVGHPDFGTYPFERRNRIIYDHASHLAKHFQRDAEKALMCQDCHTPDEQGVHMKSKGFDSSCSSCHDAQIRGKGQDAVGLSFIRVPELDIESLRLKGVYIGDWPENADGEIDPILYLLLSSEPGFKEFSAQISQLELFDLSNATDAQLDSVKLFAWAFKKLVFDISSRGHQALADRFERILGHALLPKESSVLIGKLPIRMMQNAQSSWFLDLETELAQHDLSSLEKILALRPVRSRGNSRGKRTKRKRSNGSSNKGVLEEELISSGGWYRDQFGLDHRPGGHGDQFIKSWLELALEMGSRTEFGRDILKTLADPNAAGRCTYCHSVDSERGEDFSINWNAFAPEKNNHNFTRFVHTRHFSLFEKDGCEKCHEVKSESDYLKAFEGYDSSRFDSNFASIKKNLCVECHVDSRSGDDCTSCHNYHVGQVSR